MDSIEVRRVWLRNGCSAARAAAELGTSRQSVYQHLERAHRIAPLRYQAGDPEDRAAMRAYMLAALDRARIAHP